jgi:hypothetical protein
VIDALVPLHSDFDGLKLQHLAPSLPREDAGEGWSEAG